MYKPARFRKAKVYPSGTFYLKCVARRFIDKLLFKILSALLSYLDSSLIDRAKTTPVFSEFMTKLFNTDNLDKLINILQWYFLNNG